MGYGKSILTFKLAREAKAAKEAAEAAKATKVNAPAPARSVSEIADTSKSPLSITNDMQTGAARSLTQQGAQVSRGAGTVAGNVAGGAGKVIMGAGIGAAGIGLLNSLTSNTEETPEPQPQYPINPYPQDPAYVYNPESGELIPYPYFMSGGGGTAYLSGDGYGDNGGGSGSILDETIGTLSQYAPLLIGLVVVVVIIALIAGRKGKKGKGKKKGGNQK